MTFIDCLILSLNYLQGNLTLRQMGLHLSKDLLQADSFTSFLTFNVNSSVNVKKVWYKKGNCDEFKPNHSEKVLFSMITQYERHLYRDKGIV